MCSNNGQNTLNHSRFPSIPFSYLVTKPNPVVSNLQVVFGRVRCIRTYFFDLRGCSHETQPHTKYHPVLSGLFWKVSQLWTFWISRNYTRHKKIKGSMTHNNNKLKCKELESNNIKRVYRKLAKEPKNIIIWDNYISK